MKRKPPQLDPPMRRHRALTPEEAALWREEMRERRRSGRAQAAAQKEKPAQAQAAETIVATDDQVPLPRMAPSRAKLAHTLPDSQLDRPTRGKLRKGALAIDATLDLHGHDRASAHARLVRFLAEAQARGGRIVLIITGKGGKDGAPGVLQGELARWLGERPLRDYVSAFDRAEPRHGGSGAWYVRIKRRRPKHH